MFDNSRKNHHTLSGSRVVAGALLAAAVGVGLFGCESPMRQGEVAFDANSYYESLIAREVAASGVSSLAMHATTLYPTSTLARVDQPGPQTEPGVPGTLPAASQPSIAKASLIGMPSAALNMTEPIIDLSLKEAIARAARHSLAIKVEAYNPGIKEAELIQAEAIFDPVVFGFSNWSVTDEPLLTPGNFNNGPKNWQNQFGIRAASRTHQRATAQATANINYRGINTFGLSDSTLATLNTAEGNRVNSYNITLGLLGHPAIAPRIRPRRHGGQHLPARQRDQAHQPLPVQGPGDQIGLRRGRRLPEPHPFPHECRSCSSGWWSPASRPTTSSYWQRKDLDANNASINQALSRLLEQRAPAASTSPRRTTARLPTSLNPSSTTLRLISAATPSSTPPTSPSRSLSPTTLPNASARH